MPKVSFARIVTISSVMAGALPLMSTFALSQSVDTVEFDLHVNPAFAKCVGPDPKAHVEVSRGRLNDTLTIMLSGINPNLDFDLFTVQRSNLTASGTVDPNFAAKFKGSFGLAWYQTDLHSNEGGVGRARIETILLDQIFGFDADAIPDSNPPAPRVPPTNTFHVGFWFNNPQDAVPCGFDASKPTPFNGEHKAGPLAMISLPVPPANLGPLCTAPTGVTEDQFAQDPSQTLCNP
jgi:hypothetical protein